MPVEGARKVALLPIELKNFMNFFSGPRELWHARFFAALQKLAFRICNCSIAMLADTRRVSPFKWIARNHPTCICLGACGAHDLETSVVLEHWVDVQIGGGVHVGEALKSIVGSPIAIWGRVSFVDLLDRRTRSSLAAADIASL
jgi:hypothetical protein